MKTYIITFNSYSGKLRNEFDALNQDEAIQDAVSFFWRSRVSAFDICNIEIKQS